MEISVYLEGGTIERLPDGSFRVTCPTPNPFNQVEFDVLSIRNMSFEGNHEPTTLMELRYEEMKYVLSRPGLRSFQKMRVIGLSGDLMSISLGRVSAIRLMDVNLSVVSTPKVAAALRAWQAARKK